MNLFVILGRKPSLINLFQFRCCSGEIYPRNNNLGWWGRKGSKAGYPITNVQRQVGVSENLQERLHKMFFETSTKKTVNESIDIGFASSIKPTSKSQSRKKMLELRRTQRSNSNLEKAARNRTLKVSLDEVKRENILSGGLYLDIRMAAEYYGVYNDLYGDAHFTPTVHLDIYFEHSHKEDSDASNDDFVSVTPVHRGNVIKPNEAVNKPCVVFDSVSKNSLWTLLLTNPDCHLTSSPDSECVHWMLTNIPGDDLEAADTIYEYIPPFPAYGTGFQRFIFVLYHQSRNERIEIPRLDPSLYSNLQARTFSTRKFYAQWQDCLTPAGLAFFQSDYDSSLTKFYHDVLEMPEPRYEYDFIPPYVKPWNTLHPKGSRAAFNFFLDEHRDPKDIQQEVLQKKLKTVHPFEGDLNAKIKYPNAERFTYLDMIPQWRVREIEREKLRQGYYKDLDWSELRTDPSYA